MQKPGRLSVVSCPLNFASLRLCVKSLRQSVNREICQIPNAFRVNFSHLRSRVSLTHLRGKNAFPTDSETTTNGGGAKFKPLMDARLRPETSAWQAGYTRIKAKKEGI